MRDTKRILGGREMKRNPLFLMVVFVLVLVPVYALADTVEGTIQGFTCATQGKVCPVGQEDPMIAVERVFVVLDKAGKYFFIPNLDRGILARHLNQIVRVTGKKSSQHPSIKAEKLEYMQGGAWKTGWSLTMMKEFGPVRHW
jgi:hypothetical protein